MPKLNTFYYIVDRLSKENAGTLQQSLEIIPEIKEVRISPQQGLIEVTSARDAEAQVRLACDVTGTIFRTKVKKKDLV